MSTDEVLAGADATLSVVDEKIDSSLDHWWPGTVTTFNNVTGEMQVDLGTNGGLTAAQNVSGRPFRAGQRVHGVFVKPHAYLIVGAIGPQDLPHCNRYRTGAEAHAAGTTLVIAMNNNQRDQWSMASGSGMILPIGGVWDFKAGARAQGGVYDNPLGIEIWLNGTTIIASDEKRANGGDSGGTFRDSVFNCGRDRYCNGGDQVEVRFRNLHTANINVNPTSEDTFLSATWVSW